MLETVPMTVWAVGSYDLNMDKCSRAWSFSERQSVYSMSKFLQQGRKTIRQIERIFEQLI